MAARSPGELSPPFKQLARRYSKRVGETGDDIQRRVVMPLGVRNLLDCIGAEPSYLRQLPVGQSPTCSLLMKIDAVSQSYPVPGRPLFLSSAGYCGYPTLSAFGTAPRNWGRAFSGTPAGSCPPGCHLRQSSVPRSDGALLSVEREGKCSSSAGHYFLPICAASRGRATRCARNDGSASRWRAWVVPGAPVLHPATDIDLSAGRFARSSSGARDR